MSHKCHNLLSEWKYQVRVSFKSMMLHPTSPTKSVTKISLLVSAIAGSLITTSVFSTPALAVEAQAEQLANSRSTAPEITEVNRFAVMAIAFGSTVAISLGLNAVLDRKRSSHSVHSHSKSSSHNSSSPASLNQVSRRLQRKLLRLLHEDQGAATRLFERASLKYPGEHPDWYVEKVIYDLERDRGSY